MNSEVQDKLDAAVARRLYAHLDANKDVQNIDLMILADFCRNCLSKWYMQAAKDLGLEIDYDAAREHVYGQPYDEWKAQYQLPATQAQMQALERRKSDKKG